jgi:predicted enzyme related to lactoylglutathione lyase
MTSGLKTVVSPTRDLEATTRLWTSLLGIAPHTETPYYVGWNVDGQEIGLDPHGHDKGMTGTVGYWHVPDVTAKVAELETVGAKLTQPPTDVGGGKLIARLTDADGNEFGLLQELT